MRHHTGLSLAAAITAPYLGSCVLSHQSSIDKSVPPSTASTASSAVCIAGIGSVKSHFRAEGMQSYQWGIPSGFGYAELDLAASNLSDRCRGGDRPPADKPTVDIYVLEENPGYAYAFLVHLPLLGLSAFTMGATPLVAPRNYRLCLEYNTPAGERRLFTRQASATDVANPWALKKGEPDLRADRARTMIALAESAWQSLMNGEPDAFQGRKSCREILD